MKKKLTFAVQYALYMAVMVIVSAMLLPVLVIVSAIEFYQVRKEGKENDYELSND